MYLCQKAHSPWVLPQHLVRKQVDLGELAPTTSSRTSHRAGPLPTPSMADLTGSLHDAKIFTKINLLKGLLPGSNPP